MAETKVVYELRTDGKPDALLCFPCACRVAANIDNKRQSLSLQSTSYEYHQCNKCDCYIKDRVTL